ncbi:MAG: type II toxin-antitoxin system RelE/ParE family toxin [Thermomicrobiales bacterium]
MSAPRARVTLTTEAWDDYHQLLLLTLQEWGEAQLVEYEVAFDRAFIMLGDLPASGRARDELRPGLRSFPVGRHVIYYTISRRSLRIIRILHSRMDARRALSQQP